MRALTYTLFTALAIAAAASPALADKCSDMKEHHKPPIPFVPADRTNRATGLPYAPDDLITVNGETITADRLFEGIDNLERQLTSHGYTLRNATPETLQELGACPEMLQSQVAILDMIMSDPAGPLSADTIKARVQKAIDRAKDKVPNWGEIYDQIKDADREINLPKVPTYTAPTPQPHRTPLKPLVKERSWAWDMGEKDSLWVQVQASFHLEGNKTAAKADAKGTINASVLGLWEGEVLNAGANGNVDATRLASLGVSVRSVGKTLFAKNWSKKWSDGELKEGDEKRYDAREEVSYRFALGPVPCKGTVGFIGAVGLKYGFTILPVQIMAFAVPYAATKVFAQVGADIVVASAGIGGELTLINDSVTLQGGFSATFEEEPTLVLELTGKNDIEALAGKLYAYAKVGFWPLEWEGRFTIYDWKGYKKENSLFTFRTTWGPDRITAEGDLTAEDLIEVEAADREHRLVELENKSAQRVFEVFNAIANDLNGPNPPAVQSENARHGAISAAIDATVAQYWIELSRT